MRSEAVKKQITTSLCHTPNKSQIFTILLAWNSEKKPTYSQPRKPGSLIIPPRVVDLLAALKSIT
jgi:hypothetical protein